MCKSLSSKRKHASHCRKKITYKSGSENNIEIKKNMQIVVHSMFHCYNTDIVYLMQVSKKRLKYKNVFGKHFLCSTLLYFIQTFMCYCTYICTVLNCSVCPQFTWPRDRRAWAVGAAIQSCRQHRRQECGEPAVLAPWYRSRWRGWKRGHAQTTERKYAV